MKGFWKKIAVKKNKEPIFMLAPLANVTGKLFYSLFRNISYELILQMHHLEE